MRKITVYSTKGKSNAEITTNVTTWGELKPLLAEEGYDLNSLNATENINRTDLINTGASLPEGEFTLFLRPVKTKSGADLNLEAASFRELREAIKNFTPEAKEDFLASLEGRNYTQMSTEVLREALREFLLSVVEEEVIEDITEDCTHNTVEVLNSVLTTLNCVAVSQDNEEINERVKYIFDEIIGIQNTIDESKELKLVSLEKEAVDILKGYNS